MEFRDGRYDQKKDGGLYSTSPTERMADDATSTSVHYLLTTYNIPRKKAVSEVKDVVTGDAARTVINTSRGVTLTASIGDVHTLAQLTVPERVYAIVCTVPPENIPSEDSSNGSGKTLLNSLATAAADAEGWTAALAAHRALHPWISGDADTLPSFGVRAQRRGARFKASVNGASLGAAIGSALHTRFGWRVDLSSPILEVTAALGDDGLFVSLALLRRHDAIDCRTRGGLDPHVSWAMVRSLGLLLPGSLILDPMCGKGSLLFEALSAHPSSAAIGCDADEVQLSRAAANRAAVPRSIRSRLALLQADASSLPVRRCDAIVCDLPFESSCPRFGHRLDTSRGASLAAVVREFARVLDRHGARAVLLIGESRLPALREAMRGSGLVLRCARSCPLWNTQAVICVAERVALPSEAGDDASLAASLADVSLEGGGELGPPLARDENEDEEVVDDVQTSLPWEGKGRRREWCTLRKAGRAPMAPWAAEWYEAASPS